MKKYNFLIYKLQLLLILFYCCNDYSLYHNKISKAIGNVGVYKYITICINNRTNELNGQIFLENNNFFFQNQKIEKSLLFDLTKNIRYTYYFNFKILYNKKNDFRQLKFYYEKNTYLDSFKIVLDTIYLIDSTNYYKFTMLNAFCYDEYRYNITYIVVNNRGIVGYYINSFYNNELWVSNTLIGNCLQNYIDYSQYKRFNLL